jgi:hypothetical protein
MLSFKYALRAGGWALAVAVLAASESVVYADPGGILVLLDGDSAELTYHRPAPDSLPPGARWLQGTGKPQAFEQDPGGYENMGAATFQVDAEATVEIRNVNGSLVGPNDVPMNGGAEGNIIEVVMCWSFEVPVEVEVLRPPPHSGGVDCYDRSLLVWSVAEIYSSPCLVFDC